MALELLGELGAEQNATYVKKDQPGRPLLGILLQRRPVDQRGIWVVLIGHRNGRSAQQLSKAGGQRRVIAAGNQLLHQLTAIDLDVDQRVVPIV